MERRPDMKGFSKSYDITNKQRKNSNYGLYRSKNQQRLKFNGNLSSSKMNFGKYGRSPSEKIAVIRKNPHNSSRTMDKKNVNKTAFLSHRDYLSKVGSKGILHRRSEKTGFKAGLSAKGFFRKKEIAKGPFSMENTPKNRKKFHKKSDDQALPNLNGFVTQVNSGKFAFKNKINFPKGLSILLKMGNKGTRLKETSLTIEEAQSRYPPI